MPPLNNPPENTELYRLFHALPQEERTAELLEKLLEKAESGQAELYRIEQEVEEKREKTALLFTEFIKTKERKS